MTLSGARIAVFAALRDLQVEFVPHLNLIVGENEAGKSTLYAAIRHVLRTPAQLTRNRFERELGRYVPRPDGNEIEAALTFTVDRAAPGAVVLTKRWGPDPRAVLTMPDGTKVSGAEVDSRVEAMLPVRAGTWTTLFLVGQAELDATIARLAAADGSRDEIVGVLRRAQEETGGVHVESFERALQARSERLFGRWDRERDRPEGGRGIERPWSKGVGELLRLWYERERMRHELQETVRAEEALEAAGTAIATTEERLRSAEGFVADHREAYDSLLRSEALEREIDAQSAMLHELRGAMRRWPVLREELRRAEDQHGVAARNVEAGEAGLARAMERRSRSARRDRYERARAARREIEEIRERLQRIPRIEEALLADMRAAEQRCADLRARLSAGTLRLGMTFDEPTVLEVTRDDGPPAVVEADAGTRLQAEAHRRIEIRSDVVRLEAESGDEPYDDLRSRLVEAQRARDSMAEELGVASAEDAAARKSERTALERERGAAQRRLDEILADEPFEALREEFAAEAAASGDAHSHDDELDEAGWARAAADAKQRLGAAEVERRSLAQEEAQLVERHASLDALEDRLVEVRSRLSALERERDQASDTPAGFETTAQFLEAYAERQAEVPSLREAYHEARVAQADLLARLPERTAEEVTAALEEVEREYRQVRRRADAVTRLEAAVSAERTAQRSDPFEPFARLVGRYLAIASDRQYSVIGSGDPPDGADGAAGSPPPDPLIPARYAREGGPQLAYELLSQGTRDVVALALRLALAETALGDADAPLLLDDPLVDMDPRRRQAAASAIVSYARSRQVLLFTCHPEHAALFSDAHLVNLGSVPGRTTG